MYLLCRANVCISVSFSSLLSSFVLSCSFALFSSSCVSVLLSSFSSLFVDDLFIPISCLYSALNLVLLSLFLANKHQIPKKVQQIYCNMFSSKSHYCYEKFSTSCYNFIVVLIWFNWLIEDYLIKWYKHSKSIHLYSLTTPLFVANIVNIFKQSKIFRPTTIACDKFKSKCNKKGTIFWCCFIVTITIRCVNLMTLINMK